MGWAAGRETPRGGVLRLAERALFLRPAVARVAEDALARFALSLALVDGLVERQTCRSSGRVPTQRRPPLRCRSSCPGHRYR